MADLKNPVKAIHAFCLECCGGSVRNVVNCTSTPDSFCPCPLYPFRKGKNPYRAKRELSEEQKIAMTARLKKGSD